MLLVIYESNILSFIILLYLVSLFFLGIFLGLRLGLFNVYSFFIYALNPFIIGCVFYEFIDFGVKLTINFYVETQLLNLSLLRGIF